MPIMPSEEKVETCACGLGIPVGHLTIHDQDTVVVALPLILKTFREQGKPADETTAGALLKMAKIYNPISDEDEAAFRDAILVSYRSFLAKAP